MSESRTNLRIKMENATIAKEAVKVIESLYETQNIDAMRADYFIKDLRINDSDVILEESISLLEDEFEGTMELIFKSIAEMEAVKEFSATASWWTTACGDEFKEEVSYGNNELIIESTFGEDFFGWCEECGEQVVHFSGEDLEEEYICRECGKKHTLEELFPDGLPTTEIKKFEIK